MLELASSDDPADTPGDQPARARCAAMRPAAACHDLRRTRRSHPSRRLAPRANRRRGIDPRSDRLRSPCCADAGCTQDIRNTAPANPASRRIASGTRSGDRSDRPEQPWPGSRPLAARSGVVGHRSPPRPAATRDHDWIHLASAPPSPVASGPWSSSLPVPLLGPRRRERARTPERSIRSGRGHRTGGVTPVETGHRPCSQKPVTHASRLVAQIAPSVAFGLRAENPGRRASSRLTVLPLRPLCARTSRSLLGLVRRRGHRLIRRQRPGPSSTELARRGIIDRDQTRRDRNGDWDIRSWLLSPITRRCCARMTTPARSPSPA